MKLIFRINTLVVEYNIVYIQVKKRSEYFNFVLWDLVTPERYRKCLKKL